MGKHTFTADTTVGKAIFNELDAYMQENVLTDSNNFICAHKDKCKKSCEYDNRDFFPGQLHHVGPLYDLKRDGKPFRIVVSGAEYGYKNKPSSLETRTNTIKTLNPKNPHMNGTLCLLQILFGGEADNDRLEVEINGREVHIFEAFSLANFLLCSAIPKGKRHVSGAYTNRMRKYCQNHFRRALEILQPQIIVLQGQRAQNFFRENCKISLDYSNANIETTIVCGKPVLVLPLTHPSYPRKAWGGAGHKAINEYVKPNVERLLGEYERIYH